MTSGKAIGAWVVVVSALAAQGPAVTDELLPPISEIRNDRPRVLLRPKSTPCAISLGQLESIPRDGDFLQMLAQLRRQGDASAQAMVWLLSGDATAARKAIQRMRLYEFPGRVDTFHVYSRLREFALAYDWLHGCPEFTDEIKREVRARVLPLATYGLRQTDDHVFHNYIWMSAGGTTLWALATAGEDARSSQLYGEISRRMNHGLLPAMRYLDGLPCEPMGYWAMYDLTPCVWALLGAQSAFEADLLSVVRTRQGDWLSRHFESLIHSTLPNMRYVPWGDLQSGPNGGVTHEMAGTVDALTWALDSQQGAYFSRWLAGKRGLRRFHGETAVFYMLYARHLRTPPVTPPLSLLAGGHQSGHFIARSGWDDSATIVTLRATDHFGDHNHYDQGSFTIYRNGLLAVDPPVYRKTRGPQQKTENHNTLLIDGRPQRPVRGQYFTTVEQFQKNLLGGRRLETGDMLFCKDAGPWAAASCELAQAYSSENVATCVRQLLFIRPAMVVVVDQITAAEDNRLEEVQWLLHLPKAPTFQDDGFSATNGRSWIRCRPLAGGRPSVETISTEVGTHRVSLRYRCGSSLQLVHVLEVGDDGRQPSPPADVRVERSDGTIDVSAAGGVYRFETKPPFSVNRQ